MVSAETPDASRVIVVGGESLTHWEAVLMYVIGTCTSLAEKGLVTGGMRITCEKGKRAFEALVESGFEPTQAEIDRAVRFLVERGGVAP